MLSAFASSAFIIFVVASIPPLRIALPIGIVIPVLLIIRIAFPVP